ncbi:hypothetical protein V1517DRAFT_314909 [Lipomyces orientalis]|uniref:Uncharacterized protein n=1 Tax=Lipomyces orientalis TaxID=1233043 RepID=A0ACC3TWV8_9ASCO
MSARRLIMRQKKGELLNEEEMRILEEYRLKERIRQRQLRVRKHKELSDAKATQQQDTDNRNVMDIVSILQELPFERRLQSNGRPAIDLVARNRQDSEESQDQKASADEGISSSSKENGHPESPDGRSSVDDTSKISVHTDTYSGEDKKPKTEPNVNNSDPLVPYTVLIPKSAIGAFYCVYCAFMAGHSIAPPPQAGQQQYFAGQKMFMAPPPPSMPSSFNYN